MTTITLNQRFLGAELAAAAAEIIPQAEGAWNSVLKAQCRGSEWLGWVDYPRRHGLALVEDVHRFVRDIDVHFDVVLVIGIGGSYLGTRAVSEALSHELLLAQNPAKRRHKPIVYLGHHLSGEASADVLDWIETCEPIVNVISKSGTTTEPSVAFRLVRDALVRRYGETEAKRRIIATTDPEGGALRKFADGSGYRTFPVPADIGGRFSVLSPVGMVPLGLANHDIRALMNGASLAFQALTESNAKNTTYRSMLHYAAARKAAVDHGKVIEILAYSNPKLRNLTEWWKQLFGESEGKDRRGLFPASLGLTTDLHSLGQYAQDGMRTMIETFLSFTGGATDRALKVPVLSDDRDQLLYLEGKSLEEVNDAARTATMVAHADGGVPVLGLDVQSELSATSIGSLLVFFESACAVSALLLGVNPFDQPGVEAYKKNLFALMGRTGFDALRTELARRCQ